MFVLYDRYPSNKQVEKGGKLNPFLLPIYNYGLTHSGLNAMYGYGIEKSLILIGR